MIKGINKNVIEISDIGSIYYEKAILFLKPEYADIQREILEIETRKMLRGLDSTSVMKRKNRIIEKLLIGICSAAISATLCLILFN